MLLELKHQAFAQVAREHAARLEPLHDRERLLDERERRAEQLCKRLKVAAQITGFVGHVDQVLTDQPSRRVGESERKLLAEMVAQRPFRRDIGFETRNLPVRRRLALSERVPAGVL